MAKTTQDQETTTAKSWLRWWPQQNRRPPWLSKRTPGVTGRGRDSGCANWAGDLQVWTEDLWGSAVNGRPDDQHGRVWHHGRVEDHHKAETRNHTNPGVAPKAVTDQAQMASVVIIELEGNTKSSTMELLAMIEWAGNSKSSGMVPLAVKRKSEESETALLAIRVNFDGSGMALLAVKGNSEESGTVLLAIMGKSEESGAALWRSQSRRHWLWGCWSGCHHHCGSQGSVCGPDALNVVM